MLSIASQWLKMHSAALLLYVNFNSTDLHIAVCDIDCNIARDWTITLLLVVWQQIIVECHGDIKQKTRHTYVHTVYTYAMCVCVYTHRLYIYIHCMFVCYSSFHKVYLLTLTVVSSQVWKIEDTVWLYLLTSPYHCMAMIENMVQTSLASSTSFSVLPPYHSITQLYASSS